MPWCPRLDHFARFNHDGTISRCGHMINAPRFQSLKDMETSSWLKKIKDEMSDNGWSKECQRCYQTEKINGESIRLYAIKLDQQSIKKDYLQIGGILDNICNSACQFCSADLSTKIGSLEGKNFKKVDNYQKFLELPLDQIEHLDINGGEPSNSKNYRHLINNLPPNLKTLRINTNCSKLIDNLETINQSGISVTLTVSFDGIGLVHDYVRWPIKWNVFLKNLQKYQTFNLDNLNLWTTINALNVFDLPNIFQFAQQHNLDHSYALLDTPDVLNVKYTNKFTALAKKYLQLSKNSELIEISKMVAIDRDNSLDLNNFIEKQDKLRMIKISDYIQISTQ